MTGESTAASFSADIAMAVDRHRYTGFDPVLNGFAETASGDYRHQYVPFVASEAKRANNALAAGVSQIFCESAVTSCPASVRSLSCL